MNKKDHYLALLRGENNTDRVFFRPILMHFAARFSDNTCGKIASDYKTLVESNEKSVHFLLKT